MQKLYGADPARLSVIPCGYNPAEFFPVAQQRCRQLLYLPGKARILTHIGRMVPRKGIDNIIRALQILEPQGSGIFLVVVGGTENDFLRGEVARLKAIAAESQVCDNVIFTGNKPRHLLKYYYGASDIFITTPWYEPFGITPLEAMACGIPVIGSSVGGIKFSVKHGETGLLVPPKSPAALAIAVDRLLNDAPLLNSMKENAVERTKRLFRWEEIARQVSELYHHTIWMAKPVGAFSKSA
jgi:glycosyltransferase involved in cell wall biosynthesis